MENPTNEDIVVVNNESPKETKPMKEVSVLETLIYKNLITSQLQTCMLHIGMTVHKPTEQVLSSRVSNNKILRDKHYERFNEYKKSTAEDIKESNGNIDDFNLYTQEQALLKFGGTDKDSDQYKTCLLLFKLIDLIEKIDLICEDVLRHTDKDTIELIKGLVKRKESDAPIMENREIFATISEERKKFLQEKDNEEGAAASSKDISMNHFMESLDDIALCVICLHKALVGVIYTLIKLKGKIFTDKKVLDAEPPINIDDQDPKLIALIKETEHYRDAFKRAAAMMLEWHQLQGILFDVVWPLIEPSKKTKLMDKAFERLSDFRDLVITDPLKRSNATNHFISTMNSGFNTLQPLILDCIKYSKKFDTLFPKPKVENENNKSVKESSSKEPPIKLSGNPDNEHSNGKTLLSAIKNVVNTSIPMSTLIGDDTENQSKDLTQLETSTSAWFEQRLKQVTLDEIIIEHIHDPANKSPFVRDIAIEILPFIRKKFMKTESNEEIIKFLTKGSDQVRLDIMDMYACLICSQSSMKCFKNQESSKFKLTPADFLKFSVQVALCMKEMEVTSITWDDNKKMEDQDTESKAFVHFSEYGDRDKNHWLKLECLLYKNGAWQFWCDEIFTYYRTLGEVLGSLIRVTKLLKNDSDILKEYLEYNTLEVKNGVFTTE